MAYIFNNYNNNNNQIANSFNENSNSNVKFKIFLEKKKDDLTFFNEYIKRGHQSLCSKRNMILIMKLATMGT